MSKKQMVIMIGPVLSFNRMMKLITILTHHNYIQEMTVSQLFRNFVITCGDEVLLSSQINTITVEDRGTKAYEELKEDLDRYFLGSMMTEIREISEKELNSNGKPENKRAGDDMAAEHGSGSEQPGRNQRGTVSESDSGAKRPARKARNSVSAGEKQPGQPA